MSVFDQIGNAEVNGQGVYPIPGQYELTVRALKLIKNNSKHDVFVAEFDIDESTEDARPAGTQMSWVANLTKHVSAPGNVRRFLAALGGVSIEEVGASDAEAAVADDNPFAGTRIRLEATNTKTKAGGDFTQCNWIHIPA